MNEIIIMRITEIMTQQLLRHLSDALQSKFSQRILDGSSTLSLSYNTFPLNLRFSGIFFLQHGNSE